MTVREEVVRLLNSRGRVSEGVADEPEADIVNLRAAVGELHATVVYLAEQIDRRDEAEEN